MAAKRGKHTCKCKWHKWVGNSADRWSASTRRQMAKGT